MSNNTAKQLPIDFIHETLYEREDFMVSKSNIEAIKAVDEWPNWPYFSLCIYGPEGSGKTHISHIFADNVYTKTNAKQKIPLVRARGIKLENIYRFFEESKCLIVENLDDKYINEEALFHLYNLYKNEGGYILFTTTKPPARMNFKLADLQSRLNTIPVIEIKEPDSDLLSALIVKLFADRQVNISPEIVNYITNNTIRSFSYIKKLVIEADNTSISRKRAISIPIIKEAINTLNNNDQCSLL